MVKYLKLVLNVSGPVLTKASLPTDPQLDAIALRDPHGNLLVNGKHVEGRCSHAAPALARYDGETLKAWSRNAFGPQEQVRTRWEPSRGKVTIEDLVCAPHRDVVTQHRPQERLSQHSGREFRLERDDDRETGKDRMLAVLERAGAHEEELAFSTFVRVVYDSEEDCERHVSNLLHCLRWLLSLGGEAAIGFGQLKKATLEDATTPTGGTSSMQRKMDLSSVNVCVSFFSDQQGEEFLAPFCLAGPQLDQNVYVGRDYITGGAIAGAVKRALDDISAGMTGQDFPNLRQYFDQIRFRHAFPASRESVKRPFVTPMSWVFAGSRLLDVSLADAPAVFEVDEKTEVPRFQHDWKAEEWDVALINTGWQKVTRELRTYTKIAHETGVAEPEKLYSYELIRPEGVEWRSVIDLSRIPAGARQDLLDELISAANRAPLLFGKTDARCKMSLSSGEKCQTFPEPIPQNYSEDLWIVVLASSALLLDAQALPAADEAALRQAYSEAWQEIGGDLFSLERYFARESLTGSEYLHRRFRGFGSVYSPFLLTDPGTVFVLSSPPQAQEKAKLFWKECLQTGLPLRRWAVERFRREGEPGDYWRNCPFIPQNGYGEVIVNSPVHFELRPGADVAVHSFEIMSQN